jgi:hypothetical protein
MQEGSLNTPGSGSQFIREQTATWFDGKSVLQLDFSEFETEETCTASQSQHKSEPSGKLPLSKSIFNEHNCVTFLIPCFGKSLLRPSPADHEPANSNEPPRERGLKRLYSRWSTGLPLRSIRTWFSSNRSPSQAGRDTSSLTSGSLDEGDPDLAFE